MNFSEWALPPLALCKLSSKRRANVETQLQAIELKGIYRKEKGPLQGLVKPLAASGCRQRQGDLPLVGANSFAMQVEDLPIRTWAGCADQSRLKSLLQMDAETDELAS
ncbi:hypothetical protein [Metapseudomonas resinovorans]|uniref:Uncharacterized protein n=1 Tax=Metapseudomonas resinovorans NBRC 106553 TaxID=1245471 RepID=S6ALS4_METRE|nr:hypothetical protein [Pseudomonas resinovorans]BAN49760.1 hypothetical protein PCA10_40280 [Pseudomonas resinovorans NBRC 106553]